MIAFMATGSAIIRRASYVDKSFRILFTFQYEKKIYSKTTINFVDHPELFQPSKFVGSERELHEKFPGVAWLHKILVMPPKTETEKSIPNIQE